MTIADKLIRAKEDYDAVYEAGKKAEYDRFWDAYQQNGERTAYDYAFAGYAWDDETYGKIKYDFGRPASVSSMFRYNKQVTDTVKELDLYNIGTISSVFDNAIALKKIRCLKIVSWNTFTSSVFQNCTSLEEIEFSGTLAKSGLDLHWSTNLNKDSIISVINVLSTTTTGLTVTLSLVAIKKAFETAAGANDGNTSAEWLALIGTRTNWTISLV